MSLTRRECMATLATLVVSGCKVSSSAQLAGVVLQPAAATGSSGSGPVKKSGGETQLASFTPEMFGAVGDGVTNDSDAFAKMSKAVSGAGGGTITLRATTYIVGGQASDPTGLWAYAPATIMNFDGCTKNLIIEGNGARLRCADGLRYGTFDPVAGTATANSMPYYGYQQRASPYDAMIIVQNCTGQVSIKGLELDGNLAGLAIGGQYGDTGWQIPATGLRFLNNLGGEVITGVHSHHHAQDGLYLDGVAGRTTSTQINETVSEYNGRQGCSVVGGCNYVFSDCEFNHTGRGGLMSAPGAGVDIEAQTNTIRNLSFSNCKFSNNSGVGMVADSGDSDGAAFERCTFIGTTTWSAWPSKPHFSFADCLFVGSICHTFADPDPTRAAQFLRCSFCDDALLSPTGEVYGPTEPIADLGAGDTNVMFDTCSFNLKTTSVLPWTVLSTFSNCTMSQTSSQQAYPRGTFTGVNTINGNVDIYGSKILGQLTINGKVIPPTG